MAMYDLHVAGVKFRPGAAEQIDALQERTAVRLEPEPMNRFDPHAIKVMLAGVHVGYVPAFKSFKVGQLMEQDRLEGVWIDNKRLLIQYRHSVEAPEAEPVEEDMSDPLDEL